MTPRSQMRIGRITRLFVLCQLSGWAPRSELDAQCGSAAGVDAIQGFGATEWADDGGVAL